MVKSGNEKLADVAAPPAETRLMLDGSVQLNPAEPSLLEKFDDMPPRTVASS